MSAVVEAAAKAMSPREAHAQQYEYVARKMLTAALPNLVEGLVEVIQVSLDRIDLYADEQAEAVAAAITRELKRRIEE